MVSRDREIFNNLALEEYLLIHGEEDYFMIWRSDEAVVSGKHQNLLAEVNYRYARENHIALARRLSGGGTVFHDMGNLNFSVITRGEPGKLVDFTRHTEPVIRFLDTLGIRAARGKAHEILVGGRKISGNAGHVYKNRVLHHGTLLLHANLDRLHESISAGSGKYTDRAVQSRRSPVANLSEFLPDALDPELFGSKFMAFIMDRFHGTEFQPGEADLETARQLAIRKYRSWEWIFGWSPDYTFRNVFRDPAFTLEIFLQVHRGIITSAGLRSVQIPGQRLRAMESSLTDTTHDADSILEVIEKSGIYSDPGGFQRTDLAYAFF